MKFTTEYNDRKKEITELFKATFTASEGAEEGAVIGTFVANMLATPNASDIFVVSAQQDDQLVGTAVFSRLRYAQDSRSVFILSPMAVATCHQGTGVGQKLLRFALDLLAHHNVDVALTYGDINFYSRIGFEHISASDAKPPLPLTHPEGWLGQSLTDQPFDPLEGSSTCVEALNDPALW